MNKPTIGQVIYSLNVNNSARNQKLTPVTVTKVGSKFFYCKEKDGWRDTKYRIDDWREATQYISNSVLYETSQEWEDQKEKNEIHKNLRIAFSDYRFRNDISLEQYRQIKQILEDK